MYLQYFGLNEAPFTITPDPRYVYLSRRHQDALAHLLYGVGEGGSGGFVQLTGEVGTGKTTLCRCLLEQVPDATRVALILNPTLDSRELLQAICDELEIDYKPEDSLRRLVTRLNEYLLQRHAAGERVVLVIDEAQNMSSEALEQVRLLTNLETHRDKLLQIIVLGQPELRGILARADLRQLAQRITARYHLGPLHAGEIEAYVRHRLAVAGARQRIFTSGGIRALASTSQGVPRLINIIADRALMGAYASESVQVNRRIVERAAREVAGPRGGPGRGRLPLAVAAAAAVAVVAALVLWRQYGGGPVGDSTANAGTEAVAGDNATAPAGVAADPADGPLAWAAAGGSPWPVLASLWQVPAASLHSACAAASGAAGEMLCLPQQGNWGRLRRLDLPVILELSASEPVEVLLLGLSDSHALLHNGVERRAFPLAALNPVWLGDFRALCPGDATIFERGDAADEIRQLKNRAARLSEQPYTGPVNRRYDDLFAGWIEAFQRRNGLRADGVVGPSTRLYLSGASATGPKLQRQW